MTNAELIAEIRKLAAELGTPETLPGLTKLRKPALEQLLDGLRLNLQTKLRAEETSTFGDDLSGLPEDVRTEIEAMAAHWEQETDESVNEEIDGGDVMRRWLDLPADKREQTIQWHRNNLKATPSPMREYQTSQEALAVLDNHLTETYTCVACSSPVLVTDQPNHVDSGECEQFQREVGHLADHARVDPAFAAEIDALVAQDLAPATTRILRDAVAPLVLPITETNVKAANVDVVVQLRNRLYNGKLIAVVNRRTRFMHPILATVEVGGHRFLVNANDLLAA